jgi:hypothetical protein
LLSDERQEAYQNGGADEREENGRPGIEDWLFHGARRISSGRSQRNTSRHTLSQNATKSIGGKSQP